MSRGRNFADLCAHTPSLHWRESQDAAKNETDKRKHFSRSDGQQHARASNDHEDQLKERKNPREEDAEQLKHACKAQEDKLQQCLEQQRSCSNVWSSNGQWLECTRKATRECTTEPSNHEKAAGYAIKRDRSNSHCEATQSAKAEIKEAPVSAQGLLRAIRPEAPRATVQAAHGHLIPHRQPRISISPQTLIKLHMGILRMQHGHP
jgi:hypothetical protein